MAEAKGKKTTNAVAKKEDQGGALALMEQTSATGFEETTADDYALPFLKLLQKMSPEVDEDSGSYVEGAKAGKFYDTGTGELFDEVNVIPCYYRHAIVEWAGVEPGSGFVAQHDPGYEKDFPRHVQDGRETGKSVTPEGHILQDTRYFFCLRITDDGDYVPVVISMTSTQIKKAKGWMNRMKHLKFTDSAGNKRQAPMFSQVWKVTSVAEENDQYTFRGYKVTHERQCSEEELSAAIDAREMFQSSSASVKPPEGTAASTDDDEVPF